MTIPRTVPLALLLALALALAACSARAERQPLTVGTTSGRLTGVVDAELGLRKYLGVPFARPPVGPLRWKSPSVVVGDFDRDLNTTRWEESMVCTQNVDNVTIGSEDCLYLNVIAPADMPANARLPVLVWTYGGSFLRGSAGRPEYSGQHLVADGHSIVFVALNYRVGPFGFNAVPGLGGEPGASGATGGLLGIEDQRAALQWVRLNIGAFGGDPAAVTLMGQSAGGISTCVHVASPLSAGLFRSAILQSGPCDHATVLPRADGERRGREFAAGTPCAGRAAGADQLACLRGLSTAEVMDAARRTGGFQTFSPSALGASVDGYNLPRSARDIFVLGQHNRVRLLLGSNADEFGLFVPLIPALRTLGPDGFRKIVHDFVRNVGAKETDAERALELYDPKHYGGNVQAAFTAFGSHLVFVCGSRRTARYVSAHPGHAKVYAYSFRHRPRHGAFATPALAYTGAFHQAELITLLKNLPVGGDLVTRFDADELELGENMRRTWLRFVTGGAPDSLASAGPVGATPDLWEPYDRDLDNYMDLDVGDGFGMRRGLYTPRNECAFWDEIVYRGSPLPYTDANGLGRGEGDKPGGETCGGCGGGGSSSSDDTALVLAAVALVVALAAGAAAVLARCRSAASPARRDSNVELPGPGGSAYAAMP